MAMSCGAGTAAPGSLDDQPRYASRAPPSLVSMTDAERLHALAARCTLRDQAAFAELYRCTAPKLYAVALRILRRQDWAEDVLQESFVNIWNNFPEYSAQKSAPMTWMTAVVRNRSLDWLRRPNLEQGRDDYDNLAGNLPDDPAWQPERLLQGAHDARALHRCLEVLSSSQRQSIALAYLHGMSHGEIAAHLREPLGTVKTWVRRGLEKLRECMDQSMGQA
jgi:RNA polymerase sigma-70 factor (ECF subfamily)